MCYVSKKKRRKTEVKRMRPHKLRALCEEQKGIPQGCGIQWSQGRAKELRLKMLAKAALSMALDNRAGGGFNFTV